MPDNRGKLSQTTLLLRLLCGGYLIYLGIDILRDGTASLPITGGAVVFILAGAGLLAFTLPTVIRQIRKIDEPEDPDGDGK